MATIQWRPEINPLTVPQSYKMRYVPRDSAGTADLIAEMAAENPNYTQDAARTMLASLVRAIQRNLINGRQVTIDGAFTFSLSFTGRLEEPDSPLPDISEMLHVQVRPLAPFVKEVHHQAQIEKLAMIERAPIINTAEDTRLKLDDVLYAAGVLRLTGEDLLFNPDEGGGECLIEGTAGGRTAQTQFGPISASSIVLVPDIPDQEYPWNNEHTLTLSVRYTEHGPMRTSVYRRRLRSPLTVSFPVDAGGIGILTGNAAAPLVTITGGTASSAGMLRVQAVFDARNSSILFNLLDMKEGGNTGQAVAATANGAYVLQGFTDAVISSLDITVHDFSALVDLVRNYYSGRLADVLEVV